MATKGGSAAVATVANQISTLAVTRTVKAGGRKGISAQAAAMEEEVGVGATAGRTNLLCNYTTKYYCPQRAYTFTHCGFTNSEEVLLR